MPSPLDGLNVVYAPQPVSDSHDLITGDPSQIDSSLEIWHRLPFNLEESSHTTLTRGEEKDESGEEKEEESKSTDKRRSSSSGFNSASPNLWSQPQPADNLDTFQAFLASLAAAGNLSGGNLQQPHVSQVPQPAPSLAQLLAQHSATFGLLPFANTPSPAQSSTSTPHTGEDASSPPAKRPRTRKTSVSTGEAANEAIVSPDDARSVTPFSAAEDKRRRNTAASARFRARKKEREMALETKAKELEIKVNDLEKECETLRRENNWLKGLVVGVTGAATQNNSGQTI